LKNILLVMSTSDYLAPMGDESRQKLWAETWKRLDRFLPELRKQVETEVQETEPVLKDVPQESQGAAQA
jgi:brefeldin A-resistance guanine nucleotide exchange factor 1